MGACASVPKAMRGEETAVPLPEQLKEEMSVSSAAEEIVIVENDKTQSIGTSFVEEIPKESEGSSHATTVPEIEESKPEPPSISEPVAILLPPNQKRNPPRQLRALRRRL